MISAYTPILRRPSANSAPWYNRFHSVFYLSQLTSQLFTSYLESGIENDKKEMIAELERELIQAKIVRKNVETGGVQILKEEKLKSLHIEDTINRIIEGVFLCNQDETEMYLTAMGLTARDRQKKEINIDQNQLLNATTSKNWYELISGLLNVWEFIFLYGAVESAFKEILKKEGQTREEDLLTEVLDQFEEFSGDADVDINNIQKIWLFFTEMRNIYVHNHGRINGRIKSNLGGKLDDFKKAIANMHAGSIMITDLEEILKNSRVTNEKFYFLRTPELNIFRNSMVHLLECLDESKLKQTGEF